MKKAIVLALSAALAILFLVGCAGDSAPVGASVRLIDPDGMTIDMYGGPNPSNAVIANWPPDMECEVLDGPQTAASVTFWELECIEPAGYIWVGWVDVTRFEVLD